MKTPLRITLVAMVIATGLGIAVAQDNPDYSTPSVTRCVRKGSQANHYRLLDDNGKL